METLFINQKFENIFKEKGYIKVSLFSEQEINELQNIYKKFNSTLDEIDLKNNLIYSLFKNSFAENKKFNDELKQVIEPKLNQVFKNFTSGVYSSITKLTNPNNNLQLHQDWSYVDERKYYTVTAWIPLQETYKENGALFFAKQSTKREKRYRSGSFLTHRFDSSSYEVLNYTETLETKVGEVIFFNPRVFHGSHCNKTSNTRAVLNCLITPKKAEMLHFKKLTSFIGATYKIDSDEILKNIASLSQGKIPDTAKFKKLFFYLDK